MTISDAFMKELQECLNENQDRIKTGSQLCNNAVGIQKARQKRLGYSVRYSISLREGAPSHEFDRFGDYKYCPSCGGAFDAYKNKKCPFCSTAYKLQDEEWFILDISKG